jgi:N-acetylglucosamine kinase-like BadF-type ATPase
MPPVSDVTNPNFSSVTDHQLLVVDAGGTKTAAWLVDLSKPEDQRILGRGGAVAGNPLSVGFPEAARAISAAAAAAKHQANASSARVPRAILSIAGSANHELRGHFIEALRGTGLADRVAIVSDVLPILAAGTPNCQGMALISGTGSVAFARAADGRTTLCGGWGYLLGDEGSGYAIGRAALQLAMQELERGSPPRPLSATVLDAVGATSAMDVTKTIYRRANPRGAIAAIAPIVIQAADSKDSDAQSIVDSAAADLAKLAARAARLIGFEDARFRLALSGGALVSSRRLAQQLETELGRLGLSADLNIVREPLEGCMRLSHLDCASTLLTWQSV